MVGCLQPSGAPRRYRWSDWISSMPGVTVVRWPVPGRRLQAATRLIVVMVASAAVAGRHGLSRRYVERATARAGDPRVSLPPAAQSFMGAAITSLAGGAWDDVAQYVTRTLDMCEHGALHRNTALVILISSIAHYHAGRTARPWHAPTRSPMTLGSAAPPLRCSGPTSCGRRARSVSATSTRRPPRATQAPEPTDHVEARIDRVRAMVVLARVAVAQRRWDEATPHLMPADGEPQAVTRVISGCVQAAAVHLTRRSCCRNGGIRTVLDAPGFSPDRTHLTTGAAIHDGPQRR